MTQNQKYQHNQDNHHHDDDDRARACACAREDGRTLILRSYRANVSPTITRAALNIIEDALSSGLDVDSIIMAIEQTGLAPQPSARYLAAILRNWRLQGYVTQNWKRREKPDNPALDYQQRDWSEINFQFFDLEEYEHGRETHRPADL